MLLAALSLSAIAAFYSIAGLAAIFAAAVTPIIVMGSILEVSKLVLASWLYRNWEPLPKLLKSYFLVAIVILMTLTSMGIFGFLSKAHLDQAVPSGDLQAQLSLIDEKINNEKETINEARNTLAQLDKQVNEIINRTANATDTKAVERSISARKRQATERKQLYETISTAQTRVSELQKEKTPLAQQVRKVEAEVGPIKYIAALIYGDNPDQNVLEKAVRWVIIMIVSVFDPLAVLMLVGYNWTLKNARKEEEPTPEGWVNELIPKSEAWPPYEPEFNEPEAEEFFERGKDLARDIDLNEGKFPEEWDPSLYRGLDDAFDEPEPNFDFLKGDDIIASPPPPPPQPEKTIVQEVEELQTPKKPIEYDSAGRRMTP